MSSSFCARDLARQQVVEKFGGVSRVTLYAAAEFLGIKRSTASQLIFKRRFPVPVLAENRRNFVSTAVLVEKVAADLVQAGFPAGDVPPVALKLPEPLPEPQVEANPSTPRRPRGRPRKIQPTAEQQVQQVAA